MPPPGMRLLRIPIGEHGAGFRNVLGDDDAFAGGQSVGFDDDAAARPLVQRLVRAFERMHDGRARGRNAVPFHEAFGEDLARLEPSAGTVRAEDREAGLAQAIADARGDRDFRADHDQDRCLRRSQRRRASSRR